MLPAYAIELHPRLSYWRRLHNSLARRCEPLRFLRFHPLQSPRVAALVVNLSQWCSSRTGTDDRTVDQRFGTRRPDLQGLAHPIPHAGTGPAVETNVDRRMEPPFDVAKIETRHLYLRSAHVNYRAYAREPPFYGDRPHSNYAAAVRWPPPPSLLGRSAAASAQNFQRRLRK